MPRKTKSKKKRGESTPKRAERYPGSTQVIDSPVALSIHSTTDDAVDIVENTLDSSLNIEENDKESTKLDEISTDASEKQAIKESSTWTDYRFVCQKRLSIDLFLTHFFSIASPMERFAASLESSMRKWGVCEDTREKNDSLKKEHGNINI
jgi:hypothetical protein